MWHNVLELIVLFLICVGFVSIGFLPLGWFQVSFVVVAGLLLTAIITYYRQSHEKIYSSDQTFEQAHLTAIFLLILMALLFRAEPYFYVMGGQDQGVYVNMSAVFERTSQIFQKDRVARQIKAESIRKLYERYNYKLEENAELRLEGEKEGVYLPGVYIKDIDRSEFVFQFYHLHPIWMAIFGHLFGIQNSVYSLTLFSVLSVVYLYLLAFELSGSRRLAFISGALIALNPLHAFFSKFPVTEVVALFFSSASFYYLLRYYKTSLGKGLPQHNDPYHLILSAGLMGSLFFTRISGFMYLPFLYVLMVLTVLYVNEKQTKRTLFFYYSSVFLLYLLSVSYGLTYSYPYSLRIYEFSFSHVLGPEWGSKLGLSSSIILFITSFFYFRSNQESWSGSVIAAVHLIKSWLPYLMVLVLVWGLYKVYNLGFTDIYKGNPWLDINWKMVGQGVESFQYSSIIVSVMYISPFLFALFLRGIFMAREYDRILLLFLLPFWLYISFFQWLMPYQYYYARYLLSEIVPYSILFAVISYRNITTSRYQRALFYVIIAATSCYYLYYSLHQLQGKEAEGAYESLQVIANYLEEDDLLLLNKNRFLFRAEIQTPLAYMFGKKVFAYHNTTDFGRQILPILSQNDQFNELFILSQKKLYATYLDIVDTVTYRQARYEHVNVIPTKLEEDKVQLYLYKINEFKMYQFFMQEYNQLLLHSNPYLIKKEFYKNEHWTSHHASISNFNYDAFNKKYLILKTNGWHPFREDLETLNLKVMINGRESRFSGTKFNRYYFLIPEKINHIERIDIIVNTFVPSQVIGGSQDDRHLGIDLREIYFR